MGFNRRLDTIQAAILNVKLKYLPAWNKNLAIVADKYNQKLSKFPVIIPQKGDNRTHVYHLYVIQTQKRDELLKFLKENSIQASIHYPIPINMQPAYEDLQSRERFEKTEKISKKVLSLPIYPEMTNEQINYVCRKIEEFFDKN